MSDYLAGYFAIGVAFTALIFAILFIREGHNVFESSRDVRWVMVVGVIVMICGWPAFILYYGIGFLKHSALKLQPSAEPRARADFHVELHHLDRCMTVAEIEAEERIFDPLGAAPNVPFGHLHRIWHAFAGNLQATDKIWRFEAEWKPESDLPKRFRGYAATRNGVVTTHFITSIKYLDHD